jgi:predicted RNA binding protein YcfA (HicA-like mRNA interferase family)
LQGALGNVRFEDMADLVEGFGFRLARVKGSHHIFNHPAIPGLINLQEVRGEAKPYQIRQLLRLVERYNLKLEDDA